MTKHPGEAHLTGDISGGDLGDRRHQEVGPLR